MAGPSGLKENVPLLGVHGPLMVNLPKAQKKIKKLLKIAKIIDFVRQRAPGPSEIKPPVAIPAPLIMVWPECH